MSEFFYIMLQAIDPHSSSFKILLVASEVGVTLIVFFAFYKVFNKFNTNLRKHRKENPEIIRKKTDFLPKQDEESQG